MRTALDKTLVMPVNILVHELVEACGYTLQQQSVMQLQYLKNNNRLTFTFGGLYFETFCPAEEDRNEEWSLVCSCDLRFPMSAQSMVLLLQACGIVDFTTLSEFKNKPNEQSRQNAVGTGRLCPYWYGLFPIQGLAQGATLQTRTKA